MRMPRLTVAILSVLALRPAHAQLNPPTLTTLKPATAPAGETVKLTIEGTHLDRASALVFEAPLPRPVEATGLTSAPGKIEASLAIPKDFPPGPLALRVISPRGLSNAVRLQVGRPLPVVAEVEPNDGFRHPQVVAAPCTVEGKMKEGNDVDIYAVDARAGETLVAEAFAARGGSTLDAAVTIFGPDGRALAEADDLFGRDAAAFVRVPKSGRHFVQVIDANGKSADGKTESKLQANRTYRLAIGPVPLLTAVDPPGLRRGHETRLRLSGVNVPAEITRTVPTDAPIGDDPLSIDGSNTLNLRVGDAPEATESEPNDDAEHATPVPIPASINARFERKAGGDVDVYRLRPSDGKAGDYVITVHAARIGSPADPVLAALGDDGKPLAEDDDGLGRDARIERKIEPNGLVLAVREYYGRGGERFVYRVEVEPAPAARLVVDLRNRTIPRRGRVAIPFEVADRRGLPGPIAIQPGPLPSGVSAAPLTIEPGAKSGLLLLAADENASIGVFPFRPTVEGAVVWSVVETRDAKPPAAMDRELSTSLAVSEPASLGVALEPGELTLKPGGEAEIRIRLDRRGEEAKGAVKLALRPVGGDRGGLDFPAEATVAPGANEATIRVKAKPDARPGKYALAATARFEGSAEGREVGSAPGVVVVREKDK